MKKLLITLLVCVSMVACMDFAGIAELDRESMRLVEQGQVVTVACDAQGPVVGGDTGICRAYNQMGTALVFEGIPALTGGWASDTAAVVMSLSGAWEALTVGDTIIATITAYGTLGSSASTTITVVP